MAARDVGYRTPRQHIHITLDLDLAKLPYCLLPCLTPSPHNGLLQLFHTISVELTRLCTKMAQCMSHSLARPFLAPRPAISTRTMRKPLRARMMTRSAINAYQVRQSLRSPGQIGSDSLDSVVFRGLIKADANVVSKHLAGRRGGGADCHQGACMLTVPATAAAIMIKCIWQGSSEMEIHAGNPAVLKNLCSPARSGWLYASAAASDADKGKACAAQHYLCK